MSETAKGRAQRARITAVAADLMHRDGIQGTNNDAVRRAAGISGSQLSHYFPDKEHLVRAVVRFRADEVVEGPAMDSVAALRRWAASYTERPDGWVGGCLLGSLGHELFKSDVAGTEELADGFRRLVEHFADSLRVMQERGDLGADVDPQGLATSLVAAFQGGMVLSQAVREIGPLKLALDTAIDHVELLTLQSSSRS